MTKNTMTVRQLNKNTEPIRHGADRMPGLKARLDPKPRQTEPDAANDEPIRHGADRMPGLK